MLASYFSSVSSVIGKDVHNQTGWVTLTVLYSTKIWQGETLANLAKRTPFANILPSFTKVANVSYCKFTNIFLAKTHKMIDSSSFTPPNFYTIRYITKYYNQLLTWIKYRP